MAAQADNGVLVATSLTARNDIVYVDADFDNSSTADSDNTIAFANGVTLTAETLLTLEATTGSIVPAGELSLIAGSGIVVWDNMISTANGASALVMNADFESGGDGTLTIVGDATVQSNDSTIVVTAWDLDVSGTMSAATKAMTIHGGAVDQTIGMGGTAMDMSMTDAEVGRMTATGGLTVGSTTNGNIVVDGLVDSSTDELGRVVLVATQDARLVVFDGIATSFNKGITVQAAGGVVLSASATTKSLETIVRTGTGTLTVVSTITLSTTDQLLTVTADDIDIQGDGAVTSGTKVATVATHTSITVGLGSPCLRLQLLHF
jgi:hypothetical protein